MEIEKQGKQVIDPTMLEQMVGDDLEIQAKLIKGFIDSMERSLIKLDEYYSAQSPLEYGRMAHQLKSSSRVFGGVELGDLLEGLEKAGRSQNWSAIEDRHHLVQPAFQFLKQYYINR